MPYETIFRRNPNGTLESDQKKLREASPSELRTEFEAYYLQTFGETVDVALKNEQERTMRNTEFYGEIFDKIVSAPNRVEIIRSMMQLHLLVWRLDTLGVLWKPAKLTLYYIGYHPQLASLLMKLSLSKGLMEIIIDDVNDLVLFPGFFIGWPEIPKLSIMHAHPVAMTRGGFKGLESLKELHIHYGTMKNLSIGVFEGLSNLTDLNIKNSDPCEPTIPLDLAVFSDLVGMQGLNVTHAGIEGLISKMPILLKLSSINLTGNDFESIDPDTFIDLPALKVISINVDVNLPPGVIWHQDGVHGELPPGKYVFGGPREVLDLKYRPRTTQGTYKVCGTTHVFVILDCGVVNLVNSAGRQINPKSGYNNQLAIIPAALCPEGFILNDPKYWVVEFKEKVAYDLLNKMYIGDQRLKKVRRI
jgi:hypothetical protein